MRTADLHLATAIRRASGQWREGLTYVRSRPDLLMPIVLIGFIGTFGFNFQITNALMAQGIFHRGAGSYGLLSTAQACGALVGALWAAQRVRRPRLRLLLVAALIFGVLASVSGLVTSYLLFMLILIPIGASGILLATSCNATIQLGAEPQMQGRVMALYTTVFTGGAPFGSMLVGWIGSAAGPRWAHLAGRLGLGAECRGKVWSWLVAVRCAGRPCDRAVAAAANAPFVLVFVDTPLEDCIARDPKGLYVKAQAGQIANFTGVSSPYEAPENAELVIPTHGQDPAEGAHAIIEELVKRGRI